MLRFSPLACLVVAAACGGSVSSVPASGTDGGTPSDSGMPSAYCSALEVKGPVQIVSDQPASSNRLTTAVGGAPGALVGWLSTPPGGQAPIPLRVRALNAEGAPVAGAHDVLSVLGGGGSVAWGYGRAGAVGADSSLVCQLATLDPVTGAPLAAASAVAMGACGELGTTVTGFDLLATSSGTVSLQSASSSGQPAGSVTLESEVAPATLVRATFVDHSFLLAWTTDVLSNCLCPAPLALQHFAADGHPLSGKTSPASLYPGGRFALTTEGDRAFLVTPGSPAGPLEVRALDMDGTPIGAPLPLGSATGGARAVAVDVAGIGGDQAIVAWIESSGTTQARVMAQAITSAPAAVSQPLVVAPSGIGIDVKVAASASRALVVWDGPLSGTPSQVSAALVGCAP